jgi:hypothetical protein
VWEVGGMAIYRSRSQVEISKTPGRGEADEPVVQTMQLVGPHRTKASEAEPAKAGEPEGKVIAEGGPTLVAAGIFVLALILAVWLLFRTEEFGPSPYTPVPGIGAFALFYIVAQAAERAVEFVMPALGTMSRLDKHGKAFRRDVMTAKANMGEEGKDQAAANAQAEVDQAVANRRLVSFALTAALGMALCSYLEADFLTAVGVTFGDGTPEELVQVGVTGLVVGGGSVGLHDLIGNITKSSKAKDDPVETGGTK